MSNDKFDLAKFDVVMADVDAVAEKGNFIPDMSTKDGYNASKRFVLDNTMPMRKALEAAHKEVKQPFWDACKFLDGKKKDLLAMIEAVEKPHKDAYKNHDAEIKRKKEESVKAVQSRFDDLDQLLVYCSNPDAESESIQSIIDQCQDLEVCPDFFGERIDSYIDKLNNTISQLSSLLTQKIQFEQMKKQQEEIEAKEREAQREVEKQAQIEREAEIAEQARKQALIDAENERKAQAEREEVERLRREADTQHRANINNAILSALTENGISEDDAHKVVVLAAKGQLPNLTINY